MSRDVPSSTDTALDDRFIIPVWFVEFDFDTAPLYVHTDVGDITVLGKTWIGTGGLGSISPLEETTEQAAPGVKFRLALTDESTGSIFEEITQQNFYQRDAIVYFAARNALTGALIDDPFELHRYKVDVPEITYGGGVSFVDVVAESEFIDGSRRNGQMYSNAQMRSEYPNDEGFKYVAALSQLKVVWGAKKTASLGSAAIAAAPDARDIRL